MNPLATLSMVGLLSAFAEPVRGELQVVPTHEPLRVFAGLMRPLPVVWHNPGDATISAEVRARLLQTTSATAAPLGEWAWKKFPVLPGQTITEVATLDFPVVQAETCFLIQWFDGTNTVPGKTEVRVFPTNLLAQLRVLSGGEPLGVFDPANQLQPLLRSHAIEFQNLLADGTDKFRGKLAVIGPFTSKKQMRESLADDLRALAKRGVAVVWLQPPPGPRSPLKPSFYIVRAGDGAVVVAQDDLVSRLAENPQSQSNLIRLAEAALHPEPLDLPDTRNAN